MLIDTHCHLDFKDFDADREAVMDRAKLAGVGVIINVGSSTEGSRRAVELAKRYEMVYATVGIHPHDAKTVTEAALAEIWTLAKEKKVVAIGEVGLDYYRNLSPKDQQIAAFKKFIELAQELDLPLVIHSREASDDVMSILKEYYKRKTINDKRLTAVMHCFSGDVDFLHECLDLGLCISFTCNLTFKNAKNLRAVAKIVPTERLMLETDAPFLAPEERRGKRNEPAYIISLVEELSQVLGLSPLDIARITTHNANKFFKLGLTEEKSKIAYEIRDSLYLNITNRCTNNCYFCVRAETAFVKGHNLKLDKEPTMEEILKAVGPDPKRYKEIVFCGYGEPTARLDVVLAVAKALKAKGAAIRLVTNGHGDLINKRPVARELAGLVDRVSVSLNTGKEEQYEKICKPEFGSKAYRAIVKFIKDCVEKKIETEVTCLDLPEIDPKACEARALELGASFRLRKYGVTG